MSSGSVFLSAGWALGLGSYEGVHDIGAGGGGDGGDGGGDADHVPT